MRRDVDRSLPPKLPEWIVVALVTAALLTAAAAITLRMW